MITLLSSSAVFHLSNGTVMKEMSDTNVVAFPVSWAVHGLRGGATVNASAGLQHQNSGHKVRLHAPHLLLAFSHLNSCLRAWGAGW